MFRVGVQVDIRQLHHPPPVSLPPSSRAATHSSPAAARSVVILFVLEGIAVEAAEPGAAEDVLAKCPRMVLHLLSTLRSSLLISRVALKWLRVLSTYTQTVVDSF